MVAGQQTYHIVTNSVPQEAGGRHRLGTIVDSLRDLNVLNEDEEIVVPNIRRWCIHEQGVEVTLGQTNKGSGGIALNFIAAGAPIGLDISGGGESTSNDTFGFARVDTEWFDPTPDDYASAVEALGLRDYLESSKYTPVYLITGIKIGRQPYITRSKGATIEGRALFGLDVSGVASFGPKSELSRNKTFLQKSEVATDLIFGVRVRKLAYKRRHLLFGPRQWSNEAYNGGAELVGVDRYDTMTDEGSLQVEEMDIGDELLGQVVEEEVDSNGDIISWVLPQQL